MLPFEFIVSGPPVSHQSRNRQQLSAWKATVRAAARQRWPAGQPPVTGQLQITVVYYHEGAKVDLDNDNMIKPIQDALNGLIYQDDQQITDTRIRRSSIDDKYRPRRISRILAEGFILGEEFLYIKVEEAPDHSELLQ